METDSKVSLTFDRLSLYFLAAIISPVLFGVTLTVYSFLVIQDNWGFWETVFVVALYSLPFFAFAGFPVGLYIDFSSRVMYFPAWKKSLVYGFFGALAGLIAFIIFHDLFSLTFMVLFGLVGGLLYFSAITCLKRVFAGTR